MLRAVIYARCSTDRQDLSIEAQVQACTQYCASKGYALAKTYIDEALTGTTDERPAFQQMIWDAKNGRFDVLIVYSVDRFARNEYDSAIYKRELRRAGVRRECATVHFDDSPEGLLLEGQMEIIAAYYSRNLARVSLRGSLLEAQQAKHLGGTPPPWL